MVDQAKYLEYSLHSKRFYAASRRAAKEESGSMREYCDPGLDLHISRIHAICSVAHAEFVALVRQIRLARSVEEVPDYAYNRLVEAHLPLTVHLSAQCRSELYSRSDLIQEASLKLVRLIREYRYPDESYPHYNAYLKVSLRGYLFALVCSDGIRNVYQSQKYPVYLEPLLIRPDNVVTLPVCRDEQVSSQVRDMLNQLNNLQRAVIRLRYGIDCEQVEKHKDIALVLGTTEAKVRSAEAKAMIILRSLEVVA
jgi:RNA polymerase sigma factor (sigma-70 family)